MNHPFPKWNYKLAILERASPMKDFEVDRINENAIFFADKPNMPWIPVMRRAKQEGVTRNCIIFRIKRGDTEGRRVIGSWVVPALQSEQ